MKKCSVCYTVLEDEAKFCSHCGSSKLVPIEEKLTGKLREKKVKERNKRNNIKKNGRQILLGGLRIVFVVLLVGMGLFSADSTRRITGPVSENWETKGSTDSGTSKKELSQNEYDEIIAQDERYYFCKKTESGFDVNQTLYGIFDSETGEWDIEYIPLNTGDYGMCDVYSHGEGVFSYKYTTYDSHVMFISADAGGFLGTGEVINREEIRFKDGKAFVLFRQNTRIENDGNTSRITPDISMEYMNTLFESQVVHIPEFGDSYLYWAEGKITSSSEHDIYARSFYNYNTGERQRYIYVYFYDENTYTIIDNQNYCNRLIDNVIGDTYENSRVTLEGDLIRISRLKGEDGKFYYAEFDKEGNLVTSATLMY